MPALNMVLSVAFTLEAAIQNNFSKSSEELSVVKFRYSETILFGIHSSFTYDSETL